MARDDRTEKPTQKRRDEARARGQVARSSDLTGAGILLAGLMGLSLMGSAFVNAAGAAMTTIFAGIARPHNLITAAGLHGLVGLVETTMLKTVAPIALICMVTGIVMNVLQVGARFTPHAAVPKFSRLNPATGMRSLLSTNKLFDLGKDLVKVTIVGGIVALALVPDVTHLGASLDTTPAGLGALVHTGAKDVAVRAALAYLLIGVGDYLWQRHRNEQSLKMSKQEIKDEARQRDLPPEVRRAIRRRQLRRSRQRIAAAVPKADVVITNPTHYAVALEYSGERPAPVVVAKGRDHVAVQIRRLAEQHGVPIVPDPPLARQLYATVELDQMIPAELYAAVAQVLAFVYRMAARKKVGV